MKVVIIGAGELGMLIASKLCAQNHSVVLIDVQHDLIEKANDTLELRVLEGQGTDINLLLEAGVDKADYFLALSGNESTNILACSIAKKLGASQTFCRTLSRQFLSEEKNFTPESFGIDQLFSSVDESFKQIKGILPNRILQEHIELSNPQARINVLRLPVNSIMLGFPLKKLPFMEVIRKIRLAAIIRNQELLLPNGDTFLQPGDQIYVSGQKKDVDEFTNWLYKQDNTHTRRIVIAGVSAIGERLIPDLAQNGCDVRVIVSDPQRAERILAKTSENITVLNGDMTRTDILEEADVTGCDAFAALSEKDESNILACLLASRLGAQKVIALTSKAEYMDILPDIQRAGCWFNTTQIVANAIFRMMSNQTERLDPQLQAFNAKITSLELTPKSKYCGHPIKECDFTKEFVVALILRQDEVIPPTGDTILQAGDKLISIAKTNVILKMKRHI